MRDLDESLLRQLYATTPPEFVAARNNVVKALRRDKRRDEATAVAALRRPGWDDWALNAVAASDADVVAGFADAAADVRAAQAAAIEGRDGPDIRVALRDLRDRSAELVRGAEAALAGVGREPGAGELNTRLTQVATSDVAVAQLRAGVLGSGDAAPDDLFADLRPAAPARRSSTRKAAASPSARPTKPAEPPPGPDRAELARRKEALVDANRMHAAAVKARHRAAGEVDKAMKAVERARAALAVTEGALDAARSELEQATATEQEAEAAVGAARSSLE